MNIFGAYWPDDDRGGGLVVDFYLRPEHQLDFDEHEEKRHPYPRGGRREILFGEVIANRVAKSDEASRQSREMWKRRRAEQEDYQ